MEVTLFGGLSTDHSYSMTKYAQALHAALEVRFSPEHSFRAVRGPDVRLPPFLSTWRRMEAWAREGLAIQFLYPLRARRNAAEVNHILDHSYGTLAGALPSDRTVVTCHDLIPLQIPDVFPTLYSQWTGKRWYMRSIAAMMRARRIIAISENTKQDLLRYADYDPNRIVVIPHGIDPRFGRVADRFLLEQSRKRMGLPPHCELILHVGSTAEYKNIPGLLDVFNRVSQKVGERIWLAHVGAPFTASQMRLIERWGLGERIWSTDGPPMEDLVALYNLADVLVFPSLYEGLGLPPIEAMACGLPVVASNVASLPEVLGDGQMTFPPQDAEGMADAVVGILGNPDLRQELIDEGLGRAKRFSWPLIAEQVFAVYEEVAET